MKNPLYVFVILSVLLTACGSATPLPLPDSTPTQTPVASATPQPPTVTPSPQPSPTPDYPPEGYGPSNFPSIVNPLTGLKMADPTLLDRRPLLIKVSNLPRSVRPQWGVSLADIVFEYYTEEGTTRFAAVFYGNNADMVGPIRSGRLIDAHLVRGYKAIFAFGSADVAVLPRFYNSEFADRLVVEGSSTPLTRNGYSFLMANTADLTTYASSKGIANGRQNLDGMFFKLEAPAGGQPASQVIIRYSRSIYNRWDYDPTSGKYLRFSDTSDLSDTKLIEQYAQLTDRLTSQPIAFNNLVVLYIEHKVFRPGIYDILFSGSGEGYAFRDGQVYQVKWQRNDTDVVTLSNLDGTPFPFIPGTTWFEIVGIASTVQQTPEGWRFLHQMP